MSDAARGGATHLGLAVLLAFSFGACGGGSPSSPDGDADVDGRVEADSDADPDGDLDGDVDADLDGDADGDADLDPDADDDGEPPERVDCTSVHCFYVREGATGGGTSWSDAYPVLPRDLERGAVYFVADGSYPAYLFDDPTDDTTTITIRKATGPDHGTDSGWSSEYGDGQAVWSAPLRFRTGYYVFDGATRNESDWFDADSYGFRVNFTDHNQQIKIGGIAADGSYDVSGAPPAHGVQVRYTFIQASVIPEAAVRSYQIDVESGAPVTGVVIHRCYVKDGNNHFFLRNSVGAVVEYCAAADARSNANNHGESVNLYFNSPGAIIRYNIFRDLFPPGAPYGGGTAVIAIVQSPDVSIYGNVFIDNNVSDGLVGWTGDRPEYAVPRLQFYNNTIIGGTGGAQTPVLEYHSVDCRAYDNLWIDSRVSWDSSMEHDYNAYSGGSTYGEANGQASVTTSIFVDFEGGDYRLAAPTAAGLALPAPFDVDRLGVHRGADGVWDRGAFELTR